MLLVSGAAGFYIALLGSKRPATQLLLWAVIPTLISLIGLTIVTLFYWVPAGPSKSIFDFPDNSPLWTLDKAARLVAGVNGLRFALAGLILVSIFYFLLLSGRATVPIRLAVVPNPPPAAADGWLQSERRQTMRFVWIMICLVPLAPIPGSAIQLVQFATGLVNRSSIPAWAFWMEKFTFTASLLALVLIAVGKEGRGTMHESLRIPDAQHCLLAVFYPTLAVGLWPILTFLHERILWAAYQSAHLFPPTLERYFQLPTLDVGWYVPAVFVEELAWRGYLQPRLIRRYGLIRGIFLVGIVWGAFHFSGDFRGFGSVSGVSEQIVMRLVALITFSYPLAWLTIRSKSVVPAFIAHAAYNVGLYVPFAKFQSPSWFIAVLWAVLGYVLFRFYPPVPDQSAVELPPPAIEPTIGEA